MLKFPYGFSDFHIIRTENYFYVDRTSHIPLIETAGHQLLFLRPRRFGKSLLLSMLENYYDVAKADEFEKLFGDLTIGKNPTPKHNQYLVMKWDFSVINIKGIEDISHSIYNHINNSIEAFVDSYQHLWQYQVKINPKDAISSFQSALIAVRQTPYRLYLLIDEYDNFANEVMMGKGEINPERYKTLISAEGSLKALFKTVKSASSGQGLERVFITGTSPILLSDMTTAYNVAENIYFKPEFNDLCGFKEAELEAVLKKVVAECELKPEYEKEALIVMQAFYNAYSFSEMSNELMYNPTLALYFLKHLQQYCEFPSQMLDENLTMAQAYFKVFDNRDYKDANELTIKTAFLTVLFNDVWYMMDSETPAARRYTDLTMLVRPDFRHTRLLNYRTSLESKYDKVFKLELISVVAVGFDRLVWKKVV